MQLKTQKYIDVLSEEIINDILDLPEVVTARNNINNKSSVYFTINLDTNIKNIIENIFNLNLSKHKSIPMRWIK